MGQGKKFATEFPSKLTYSYMSASTLSSHFAHHCKDFSKSRKVRRFIRDNIDVNVIWKEDNIKTIKNIGMSSCQLCMQEHHNILNKWRCNKIKLMNSRTEILVHLRAIQDSACLLKNSGH